MTSKAQDISLMSADTLEKLGLAVAQQKAMERGGRTLSHGCRLFDVQSGWESDHIRSAENAAVCDSALTFEEALGDETAGVIFIPKDAMITEKNIEEICHRHGVTKTIFREVESA